MDTVIQFVGLFVFTTATIGGNATGLTALEATSSNINQSVVIAIAPSVIGDPRLQLSTTAARSKRTPTTEAALANSGSHADFVEAHTTMITYRKSDLVSPIVGWNAIPLKPTGLANDDWYYVELSGEQVTFVADRPSAEINPTSLNQLPLRHLGHTLMSAYTLSENYRKAAGVFTIPTGTLSVCSNSKSSEALDKRRIDTRLTLHTRWKLAILGPDNKSIMLWAGAPIFVGNIPLEFAKTGMPSEKAHEHYKVYCEMVGDSTCTWPPQLTAAQTVNPDTCADDLAYRRRAGHPETPTLPRFAGGSATQASDYACSNSQWP